MATYNKLLSLINGMPRTVDFTANTLQVQALEVGSILLSSSTSLAAGSTLIGDDNSYTNFTPTAATVKGALAGIDAALAASGQTNFSDAVFFIFNNSDNTKKIAFSAANITTGHQRTITMPDFDVNLGALTNSNIASGAAIAYSKLNLAASVQASDINSGAAT